MTNGSIQKYRVLFKGEIEAGQELQMVKEHLAQLFKTTPERIDKLFTGKPVTLNHNLDLKTAQEYIATLKDMGAICYYELMTPFPSVRMKNKTRISSSIPQSTLYYNAGLWLVTIGMIILPLIYIFLIFFIAGATYGHIDDNASLLDVQPFILGLLAYILPIFIGIFFVGSMLKSLFAPPTKKRLSISLSRKKEPVLYAFIDKLSRSIGSLSPSTIEVDCSINTSVCFRRGLLGFLENELTLIIGLPLAAELTLTEFTGILAHEFRHFTKEGGIRFFYIISSINNWFARLIFDRDIVDQKLSDWSITASGFYVQIPLQIVRFVVWLTRKILLVFNLAANFISKYFLLQMEFDADECAVRTIGSEAFIGSIYKLHLLTAASEQALMQLKTPKKPSDNSLPDNLVLLISSILNHLSEEETSQIKKSVMMENGRTHVTHPTDRERINRAKKVSAKTTAPSDKTVSTLFTNFEELTKTSTVQHYHDVLGLQLTEGTLVPVSDYLNPPDLTIETNETELNIFTDV